MQIYYLKTMLSARFVNAEHTMTMRSQLAVTEGLASSLILLISRRGIIPFKIV